MGEESDQFKQTLFWLPIVISCSPLLNGSSRYKKKKQMKITEKLTSKT
jgi:hypothetical protein